MSTAPESAPLEATSPPPETPVVAPAAGNDLLPTPNTVWRNNYKILEALPAEGNTQWWRAQRVATGEDILLSLTPAPKTTTRSSAWKHLKVIELIHLQRAYEEFNAGPNRVEIHGVILGQPLATWSRERGAIDFATIELIVRQLTEAIGVLHASGLVHLGLSTRSIFVDDSNGPLQCTVGALGTVTLFDHGPTIVHAADPLYAPPEAVQLQFHEPNPQLCAWDWWSLGRIVQELLLGQPVIDLLPGGSPEETVEQKKARGETLLLENAVPLQRAGAVEAMPTLESRALLLLRGLLASAPDVRWRMEAMDSWIRQLPVKESYDTKRVETKFRWGGRLYTIPEVAKTLQTAEHWEAAIDQLFDVKKPGTLGYFISKSTNYKNTAVQVKEALQLVESEPLCSLPTALAREAAANIALLILSGKNLTWRGKPLDGDSLSVLLAEAPDSPENMALVRAFVHRTVTGYIERFSRAIGRSLIQAARYAEDAEEKIRRNGWLSENDASATEKIFHLTIEPLATLRAIHERLKLTYAYTTHPALEKSFLSDKPTRLELVVLAWIEPNAAQNGFLTHLEWEARQLQQLLTQSRPIASALFWVQQAQARNAGAAVFGALPAILATWGAVAAVLAWVLPQASWPILALLPALLALGIRTLSAQGAAAELQRLNPEAEPWKWTDGVARCTREMIAAGKGSAAPPLEHELNEIDRDIAKLKLLSPAPSPVLRPRTYAPTRMAARASWALILFVVLGGAWQAFESPPSLPTFQSTPVVAAEKRPAANATADKAANVNSQKPVPASGVLQAAIKAQPAVNAQAASKSVPSRALQNGDTNKASTADLAAQTPQTFKPNSSVERADSTASVADKTKPDWPYPTTGKFERLQALESVTVTEEQTAFALRRGRRILAPYRTETTQLLLILEVPAGDKIGAVIFDGAEDALAVDKVFILNEHPLNHTWAELERKKAFVVTE